MIEVERVREKMARLIYTMDTQMDNLHNESAFIKDTYLGKANQILSLPEIQIKADDQSLPERDAYSVYPSVVNLTQQDMLKAGFIKVVNKD